MLFPYKPRELKCEYKHNPRGIDKTVPRLSWITDCDLSDSIQTAYRILAASSPEKLNTLIPDLWDSGKVPSSESARLLYKGQPLKSNCTYYWQVMIWINGIASKWSDPAWFTTGLLNMTDWKAKWISAIPQKKTEPVIYFQPGIDKWIWHPLKKPEQKFKTAILKKCFTLKDTQPVQSAFIIVTADEKFSLYLNNELIAHSDDRIFSWSRPVECDVKNAFKQGQNILKAVVSNSYVEKPGFLLRMQVEYSSGEQFSLSTDKTWFSSFEGIKDVDLTYAEVVAVAGEKPWRVPEAGLRLNPAVELTKSFSIRKKVKQAFINCSALGLYHLDLNGNRINNSKLSPLWSSFHKRAYYNSFDVTDVINNGLNSVNIILADGYYAGYCGWEKGREYYGKHPAIKLQLIILYEDGTEDTIISDESWSASQGPFREADILMGETYDSAWDKSAGSVCRISVQDVDPVMTSYEALPVQERFELKPQKITRTGNKKQLIDFGQNFAGYLRLKLNSAESRIVLRHSEVLNPDGTLYTENIRMARSQDTYIPKGEDEEVWEPSFTYHGFRYAEITGLDEVNSDTVTGIAVNSLSEQTGFFNSSDEKLNKLFSCILWNQRSNYIDIPTDCPQRDERFGWTGDAVSYLRTAAYNYDVAAFYSKWLNDLFDEQRSDGSLPPFAPLPDMGVGPVYFNSAGWADAGIAVPYWLYHFYNDKEQADRYYERMKLFIESLVRQCKSFMMTDNGYGDWLCSGEPTSKPLISIAYFAYDISLMAALAAVLDHNDDSAYYNELFSKVKKTYRSTFLNRQGSLKNPTQTAAILSLHFNLLDEYERAIAFDFLVKDIIKNNYHTTAGFLGLSFIMPVLNSLNRNDIAWRILTNNEYPSWFNMIDNGATTLWERWDAWHPEKGFFDPTMNSFNHCSLGCVGEWLFSGLAGITPLEPGFKKISIKPYFPEDLSFVEASFKSVYGTIRSHWKKTDSNIEMNITIPFNTTAEIILPGLQKKLNCGEYQFLFPYPDNSK